MKLKIKLFRFPFKLLTMLAHSSRKDSVKKLIRIIDLYHKIGLKDNKLFNTLLNPDIAESTPLNQCPLKYMFVWSHSFRSNTIYTPKANARAYNYWYHINNELLEKYYK